MKPYFRLLPLTMLCALLLFAVKLGQAIESGESLWVASVSAASAPTEEKAEQQQSAEEAALKSLNINKEKPAEEAPPEKTEEKPKEEVKDAPKQEKQQSTSENTSKAAPDGKESEKEKKEGEEGYQGADFFKAQKKVYKPEDLIGNQLGGTRPDDRRFSPIELQLLQQLSERRKQLDERESQLVLKENLITQTEKRVDEKFNQMTSLKTELAQLIAQHNDIEATKIKSLVKIYENMKPQDAARIFDEVEMPILLIVIDKMSEKKAAPILARMDSKKAKMLTVELAEQRQAQDSKIANQKPAPTPVTLQPKP